MGVAVVSGVVGAHWCGCGWKGLAKAEERAGQKTSGVVRGAGLVELEVGR